MLTKYPLEYNYRYPLQRTFFPKFPISLKGKDFEKLDQAVGQALELIIKQQINEGTREFRCSYLNENKKFYFPSEGGFREPDLFEQVSELSPGISQHDFTSHLNLMSAKAKQKHFESALLRVCKGTGIRVYARELKDRIPYPCKRKGFQSTHIYRLRDQGSS